MNEPVPARLLLAGALLLAGGGCRPEAKGPPGVPGPIASALLAFAAEQGTAPAEVARAWRQLESIAAAVSGRAVQRPDEDPVDGLNAVVFEELGFKREITVSSPQFLLLPSVLASKAGGCLGLSGLYLALGERLGLPITGILVPGHFFVRSAMGSAGRHRNIELLRGGEAMPDQWYRSRYGPWGPGASAYLRPLEIAELVGVHWFNRGNQLRAAGQLQAAGAAFQRAAAQFPSFAEASANLGVLDQLKGDLPAAARAYHAAARARPDLPGLAHNLSLLESESAAAPALPPSSAHESGDAIPRRSWP